MKDYIEERAMGIATYIIENNATVRQTAKAFGVSKSTVHKDVTDRLMQINPTLAKEARCVLDVNKSMRTSTGTDCKCVAENKENHITCRYISQRIKAVEEIAAGKPHAEIREDVSACLQWREQ